MNLGKNSEDKKKRILTLMPFLFLLLFQLVLFGYYGNRKAGFHEDELYSYYSTNKTAGLSVSDRKWLLRDDLRNDFVVLKGEQFRYGVVKQMQSWDVHPPFYYYILHTICSLFPGVFSKWLGILVNLIAFVPCFFLLAYLVYSCLPGDGKNCEGKEKAAFFAFAVCSAWGFSAAVISGVMFIRMYQWLTLFILLCACLHVRALKKKDFGPRFLIPLAVTVFLGFMTQYYYIIFHFFLGAGFCMILLKEKRIKNLAGYVISCAAGLAVAILYYPSSMAHIFRGYRGTEAVSEFGNAGNTLERLSFFLQLFDEYVVNGFLSVILLCICLLWITVSYLNKRTPAAFLALKTEERKKTGQLAGLLLFACAGYFFTVSKTALLLGETSNRYQLPIYGILLFLLLYYLWTSVELLMEKCNRQRERQAITKQKKIAALVLLALVLLMDLSALRNNKVFFLYEEEQAIMEYVQENRDVPVVVFYNEASPANVWRLSNELMEFPKVYLASMGNPEEITEKELAQSNRLLVFAADYDNGTNCLDRLVQSSTGLSEYRMIAENGLWTLYEMT